MIDAATLAQIKRWCEYWRQDENPENLSATDLMDLIAEAVLDRGGSGATLISTRNVELKNKLIVIKGIREVSGLGLKESKLLFEDAQVEPQILYEKPLPHEDWAYLLDLGCELTREQE